ncbi:hypothetical protein GEMRC1_009492 [Eukaryota sp. GEM-RC1]
MKDQTKRTFNVEELLNYSNGISGLELELHNDLEFLNKSSLFSPLLKQLHVGVNSSISMLLIELLKVNTTVTNIDLNGIHVRTECVRALAEVLKVNTTITSIDLSMNSVGDAGDRALAEALKVNSIVNIRLT